MLKLVAPKPEDRSMFDRLAQLYAYDFSQITGLTLQADGVFPSHKCFTQIWSDPTHIPHLFMMGTEIAGFSVVHQLGDAEFDMEQFFVLRKFRRSGLGREAAHKLFHTFSGKWTVEQITANKAAQAFWRSVISEYTKGHFKDPLVEDPQQSFTS